MPSQCVKPSLHTMKKHAIAKVTHIFTAYLPILFQNCTFGEWEITCSFIGSFSCCFLFFCTAVNNIVKNRTNVRTIATAPVIGSELEEPSSTKLDKK